ncbi:aldose 1-epimerase [Roseivirga sp.]|uniref:aldose 1-epimerase n=1 Tax=Roseivirga sp. TaxID=1964215 RepID=UPI003B8C7D1E
MLLSSKNQSLEIDLTKGAAISHLTLSKNGKRKVLISPKAGYHYESSLLFPFPNRLAQGKFIFEGTTYKFPLNDFGRPNALHGFISDKPFQILSQENQALILQYEYDGGRSYYPFPFRLIIKYKLEVSELIIEATIENTGISSMPCGFGWHPYFNMLEGADQAILQLKDVSRIVVDKNLLPTGKSTPYKTLDNGCIVDLLSLDTCFEYNTERKNATNLRFQDGMTLKVWQDSELPFVQIYTAADDKTIAIEPMTCSIDALNTGAGLKVLESSEHWSFQFGVKLH